MTLKPKDYSGTMRDTTTACKIKDDIVISGVAGLYPKSHDVKELYNILYNKVNPVEKTDRWSYNFPEISQYVGTIPDLQYFDAQFFKVHHRLSNLMDPMSRKLLEQTYQAIFDAGFSPEHLSGRKIGVFVGNCYSETEKAFFYVLNSKSGLGIAGCNRSMFSNRISYYLNLKGPSMSVDMSCSSSTAALEMAYDAISRGECEAAIVGGANLCLHPQTSIHYGRVVDICKDGKTKCFDANAEGFCKSEAVNVVFLQKKKDALRVYARIVHAKSEFMALPQSEIGAVCGFHRDPADILRFLEKFYQTANVSPKDVQFVEAFGSSSKDGDKTELIAIDEFFCKDRAKPLMVGSIMSNIGYVEAASGLASITKVLLAYHNGKLAANLHYNKPRDDIDAIREGRIEIITDHKEFIPTYAAINNLSMTGVFAHVLLSGNNKKKDLTRYTSKFPRIVLGSGRQETSVQKIFNYLKSKPIDPEEQAILHHFHEKRVNGHLGRGFIILDTNKNNETVSLIEECAYFDQAKRPLWFVYSGMGSQWAGMGKDLMRIPIFAASIERCHRVLEPKGINIIEIITTNDKKIFDNILHTFVGITAIQIGLTDVLRAMDIAPDMLIGHSMGEIGCAYADGCFTSEEAILCSYSRGLVSIQTPLIRGSMAAVGLGHKEMSKMCPPEIEIACHNSAESCTISGPAEIMKEFVSSLTNRGIFAKEVPCSNIAYHSQYIADAGPALLKYMQDQIKTPRPRSPRWVSTSVPQDRWDEPLAKYSSAEYHTNNLLSPVLFEETSQLIPPDAVLIEIAPHALLQAILKRSVPTTCKLLPLTRRGHPDVAQYFLEATGRLYMEGFNPKVKALYPEVEFPVSTSTPMLSHLVDWVYQEEWTLHKPTAANKKIATTSQDVISTYDVEHSHLKGHIIRGKVQYPFAAALVAVWDTMAASLNVKPRELSVQFENLHFYTQPFLHKKRQLRPFIAIQKGSGRFEVLNENSIIMTGTIIPEIKSDRKVHDVPTTITNISSDTIYKLLFAKEYYYINDFRSIHSANESLTEAKIEWKDNWVTFLDGIIQMNVLRRKHHTVSKLSLIRKIVIDVEKQRNSTIFEADKCLVNAQVLDLYDLTVCGGVVMETVKFVNLPLLKSDDIELITREFVPLFSSDKSNEKYALYTFLQIVADNVQTKEKIRVVEISETFNKSGFSNIEEIIYKNPGIRAICTKININEECENVFENVDLILVTDLLNNKKICEKLETLQHLNTFIIHKQQLVGLKESPLFTIISSHIIENGKVDLAILKSTEAKPLKSLVVRIPKGNTSQDTIGGEYYLPLEDKINLEQGATLKITNIGDLGSLYWVNEGLQYNDLRGVEVKIQYIGVNIVYVNKLLGTQIQNINEPTKSVMDFSGLTKSGTRVMGIIHSDMVSSLINSNPELLLPVPEHWTLEDAATVPLAYSMAFYILFIKVQVKSKHVICVQGAAGALGQAIISVALAHGCEVFATVSSNSKKQYLRKIFPRLKDDHIIDHSRDLNFVYEIQRTTKGKGCNLLVSCATDELKNFSFRCLGSYGVMLDTNVVANQENYNFGMDHLSLDKVYYPTDFSTIFQPKFADDIKLIRLLMVDGIRRGYVRPLTRVTYQAQDAPRAFHLQAAGNNRGRVLLDLRQLKLNIIPRITCTSSSWQLVVSDNEKFALKFTERLIGRGAKKIFLQIERTSSFANIQIKQWEHNGVNIKLIEPFRHPSDYSDLMMYCENDGLLESIFIITSNEKASDVIKTTNNYTAIISKYNYCLRYFAAITTSGVDINPEYFETTEYSMMVTRIKLPEIVLTQNNQKPLNWIKAVSMSDAIDALERALCSQKKIVIAHKSNTPRKTLLRQIMSLADTNDLIKIENLCVDFTFNELNMEYSKLLAIQSFLRDVYEIHLSFEALKKLSVKSINEIESRCVEFEFEENQGISLYFPTLYTDELLYSTDMLYMSTLCLSGTSYTEINLSRPYLCIVPGVEGYHERFTELCERLKLPAIALQPGLDHPNETIPELANRFINVLKKKAALNNNFYLLGYESGIFVALEMAAILEKNGLTGTVFCIGGTPAEVRRDFQNNLKCYNNKEQLQMGVLKNAYSLITKEDPSLLDQFCREVEWTTKLDACMNMLLGKFPHSIQYTRKWIDYKYRKLSSLLENTYKPKNLLSQIISLRPSYKYASNMDMSLQSYSDKEIITYPLETPLSCAPQDMMCASVINSHLDDDTLERFMKRNICQSYAIVTENDTL